LGRRQVLKLNVLVGADCLAGHSYGTKSAGTLFSYLISCLQRATALIQTEPIRADRSFSKNAPPGETKLDRRGEVVPPN